VDIVNEISSCRKALGFTQSDMSKKLGVSMQSYYRKEKGYVPFTDSEKVFLLKLFKTKFPELTIDSLFFNPFTKKCKEEQEVNEYAKR